MNSTESDTGSGTAIAQRASLILTLHHVCSGSDVDHEGEDDIQEDVGLTLQRTNTLAKTAFLSKTTFTKGPPVRPTPPAQTRRARSQAAAVRRVGLRFNQAVDTIHAAQEEFRKMSKSLEPVPSYAQYDTSPACREGEEVVQVKPPKRSEVHPLDLRFSGNPSPSPSPSRSPSPS